MKTMEFSRKGGHILSSNVVKKTEDLVLPILKEQNFELVDIEYTKEGSNWYLRVYIDKDGGIEIDECGLVSEKLSEQLDKEDPIKDPYFLEVSSPGVERPLKTKEDLKKHVGSYVNIRLYEKIENDKEFEGTIQSFENNVVQLEVKIKTRKKIIEIPYKEIESTIQSCDNNVSKLEVKDNTRKQIIEIPYEKIGQARLAVSF